MDQEHNNGSQLEGLTMIIAGILKRLTNGSIDFTNPTITNEPDGGIDGSFVVEDADAFFDLIDECVGEEEED